MKTLKIFFSSLLFLCALSLAAQRPVVKVDKKWDAGIQRIMTTRRVQTDGGVRDPFEGISPYKTLSEGELLHVTINVSDAAAVLAAVQEAGYEGMLITDAVVTAEIPLHVIETLAQREDVLYIVSPVQYQPLMDLARVETGVDKLHVGIGLETPFTGKGVLIGVIDQGFEFKHAAFLDDEGKSRVVGVWNRRTGRSYTTTIPSGGDTGTGGVGHATHVTNIACGSDRGNGWYGVAPEADILMIPSKMESSEVVEDIKKIKEVAESRNQPWVVNMSFGGNIGPHDGTLLTDRTASNLSGPGGILVAAMGNSGDVNIHAQYTFKADGETVDLLCDDKTSGSILVDIWCQEDDGKNHLTIKPFVFANGKKTYPTDSQLSITRSSLQKSIGAYNGKQCCSAYIYLTSLLKQMSITASTRYFGFEITGEKDVTFHAWSHESTNVFTTRTASGVLNCVKPDVFYQVGEGAAVIEKAVAVSSYNSRTSITNMAGRTYSYRAALGNENGVSKFTSPGPMLQPWPKPAVIAPGAIIYSAISQNDNFDKNNDMNVGSITFKGSTYYYQGMTGTSMASPYVAGSIALWLQACPTLTYENIIEIFRATCKRDLYTDTTRPDEDGWDRYSGYGKLDTYEGLKYALRMASETGIEQTRTSETPITLQKGEDAWRILFNNDEGRVRISLMGTDGKLYQQRALSNVQRGEEEVISLPALPAGVYLLRIQTEKCDMTRKLLVR